MEAFIIIFISILLASSMLYQFFMDYKRERVFAASVELVIAIMWITSCVCSIWYCTLQTIT